MANQGGGYMNEAIMRYKTAMSVFKEWHKNSIINSNELASISQMIAQKHGISLCSIFLEKT